MDLVSLTSNGDGTGRLEIRIDCVRIREDKPGIYHLLSLDQRLPQKVKCGESELRPHLVLKLYCKVAKGTRILQEKNYWRLRKLERLNAG